MKIIVKSLKAAWPEGVKLGDVVSVDSEVIPDSLVGKCSPAPDDAEAVADYAPPALPDPRDPGSALVPLHTMPAAGGDASALAAAEALLAEARTEADELRARVVAAEAESAKLREALAAAEQAAAAKGKKG